MQPNPGMGQYAPTPTPSSSPTGTNQYDFIMEYQYQHQHPRLTAPSSMRSRILIVVGGFILLLIVLLLFMAILKRPTGVNGVALLPIAQEQTELARVAQAAVPQSQQPSTQDFAQTASLSLTTDQQAFVAYMGQHGFTASQTKLAATRSTATDSTLTQAETTGSYDSTFLGIAQAQLATYTQTIKRQYDSTTSTSERQLLQSAYAHAQLLTAMSKQTY